MITVDVNVKNAPYTIFLGAGTISVLKDQLQMLVPTKLLIVTNVTVGKLYGAKVKEICSSVCKTEMVELPDGEQFKKWSSRNLILTKLARMQADRKSVVVALGGGVVGDLAGFAAAIYMRGIKFVQVPTTLLALVDSSVGGKTGMNLPEGKNLVGAFHQPSAVIADINFLKTLPKREVSAGLAEIIKHGLLADKKYFEFVEQHIEQLRNLEPEIVTQVVAGSCEIKAEIVRKDTKESSIRALLNLGHTFGHAIEKLTGYGTWLHGEAVGCGLVLAARASQELLELDEPKVQRIISVVEKAGLPTKIPGIALDEAILAMKGDKKSTNGKIHFILLKDLGQSYIAEMEDEDLTRVLSKEGYVS